MVVSGQLGQERAAQKHEEEQFGPKDSARQIGADAGAGAQPVPGTGGRNPRHQPSPACLPLSRPPLDRSRELPGSSIYNFGGQAILWFLGR